MTTIVAILKNNKVILGADTLTKVGRQRECADKMGAKPSKIFRFRNMYIAIAGLRAYNLSVRSYLKKYWKTINICHFEGLVEGFRKMHKVLQNEYYLTPHNGSRHRFGRTQSSILVASRFGIFEVEADQSIRRISTYTAQGSGQDYALGAMRAVYESTTDPRLIAEIGLKTAAKFDKATELPLTIVEIDLTKTIDTAESKIKGLAERHLPRPSQER